VKRFAAGAVVVALAALLLWRPFAAWLCDDLGNLAYARGDAASAEALFAKGLTYEPAWHVLLEDHGRSVLERAPATALADFRAADCGAPCVAEAGDAESRLGRARAAVDDYLAAHAVDRVGSAAHALASAGRFADAIALERALAVRLDAGMLDQADLATAYFTIGRLDREAAARDARRASRYEADAIASFDRASDLAPFNEEYLLSYGYAELQWGNRDAARSAFERVLDLHPHEFEAERGLAALAARRQRPR